MKVRQAAIADYDGILTLHRTYHTDYIQPQDRPDGFVTTNFSPSQLERLIQDGGVTIAQDEKGTVVSYAMAAPWTFWAEWPFFAYMIEKLPENSLNGQTLSVENSYQYGPICVHKSMRGTGLFEQVFYSSAVVYAGAVAVPGRVSQSSGSAYAPMQRPRKILTRV